MGNGEFVMGKVRGRAGTLGRTGVRCAGPTPYEKLRTNDYSGSQESKVLFQCPARANAQEHLMLLRKALIY